MKNLTIQTTLVGLICFLREENIMMLKIWILILPSSCSMSDDHAEWKELRSTKVCSH